MIPGTNEKRELLPSPYEKKYKSEELKEKIADLGMWAAIPAVTGSMNSRFGVQRLKENDPLFSFIDEYFSEEPYAFEPNMEDGRFVFLPDNVSHQGIGICASKSLPGFLEVGHFWYPREYTDKNLPEYAQVYVPMFSVWPNQELLDMVKRVYWDNRKGKYCTFPFLPDTIVTLEGDFLDNPEKAVKIIRKALKDKEPQIQRSGEGLIMFIERLSRQTQPWKK